VLTIAVAIFCATFVVSARMFAKREGYYSTVVVFGIAAFLYYIGIPLEMRLTDSVRLFTDLGVLDFGPELQGKVAMMGAMAYLSFVVGYRLTGFRPVPAGTIEGRVPEPMLPRVPLSVVLFAAGSTLLLVVLYRDEVLASGTYENSYTLVYSSAGFAALQKYAAVALALLSATLLGSQRKRPLAALLLALPALWWGVYSSNKNPMLVALLGVGSYLYGRRSRKARTFFVLLVAAAVGAVLWPIVFSQFRAGHAIQLAMFAERRSFLRSSDPAGPMISLLEYASQPSQHLLGESYVLAPLLWIPKVMWPGRPLDLSEAFARDHIAHWAPGLGLGYSLLAEAWNNFGWFGPVLQYLAIGLLWGFTWKLLHSWFNRVSPAYWRAVYATFGYYLLIIMHRGPTSSIVTFLMQVFVPLVALSFFVDKRAVRAARPAASRPAPNLLPGNEVASGVGA
jgi:oligosaccharide repeat unit polymerase